MSDSSAQPSNASQASPYTGYKRIVNPLFIMLLLFGLPYAGAWYFMYSGDPVSFEKPNNHGQLVSPMVQLGQFSLTLKDGSILNQADLAGNWLLFTTTSSCETTCQETLFTIRQIRKAMGVNRQVIKPIVLLSNQDALKPLAVNLDNDFPQLAVITQQTDDTLKLLKTFTATKHPIENSIFMVDPFGNLMMVYPAGSDQKGMLKDLQRLLKVNKPKL